MSGAYNQMKDLYKMQKEARSMQKKLKAMKIDGLSDSEEVKISMNGAQEIVDIEISDELMTVENKKELVKGIKQANKDAQRKLQKEMMKDMDMSQLKNMLG